MSNFVIGETRLTNKPCLWKQQSIMSFQVRLYCKPSEESSECLQRTLSESRVRENRTHGLMRGAGNPCLYSTGSITFFIISVPSVFFRGLIISVVT